MKRSTTVAHRRKDSLEGKKVSLSLRGQRVSRSALFFKPKVCNFLVTMKVIALVLAVAVCAFADDAANGTEDTHLYDTIITHVKPEHWYAFKNELQKHHGFEAKHGITIGGRYKPIAGNIGDLVTFVRWDNMEQRVAKLKELFEDADFKAHHEKNAHFVDDVWVSTSVACRFFPIQPPAPGSFVHVHKIHVKGAPNDSVKAFKEFFDAANEKHFKPNGMKLIGLWHPVFGKNVQSYTVSWELTGDKPFDAPKKAFMSIMGDESMSQFKEKLWNNVVRRESYLLAPVNITASTF